VYQENLPPDKTSFTPPKTLLDGEHTYLVHAFDQAGNSIASKEGWRFSIDSASPQSTITVGKPSRVVDNLIHVEDTTPFTINVDDGNGSGVALTEYKIDDGDWRPYSGPFTVPLDGRHLISYRSTDKAGNVEDAKTPFAVFVELQNPWDVNRDGRVDIFDLIVVAQHFGASSAPGDALNPDVNRDGKVDLFDLILIRGYPKTLANPGCPSGARTPGVCIAGTHPASYGQPGCSQQVFG